MVFLEESPVGSGPVAKKQRRKRNKIASRRKERSTSKNAGREGGNSNEDSVSAAAQRGWLYFSKHQDHTFKCDNCGNTDIDGYRDDFVEDFRICKACGCIVSDHLNYCYDLGGYSFSRVLLVYGTKSEYRRVYHFSERLAQWLRIGPCSPGWLVDGVDAFIGRRATKKQIVDHLNAGVVKEHCRSVGLYAMKYAERWIDVRMKIIERRGIDEYKIVYPTPAQIEEMKRRFAEASHIFDLLFYKQGNRRTAKDNVHNSEDFLARHNFVNYNYCIHQLLWSIGMHGACEAHFYFPLLRTDKVLKHLETRWARICEKLDWDYASLEELGWQK